MQTSNCELVYCAFFSVNHLRNWFWICIIECSELDIQVFNTFAVAGLEDANFYRISLTLVVYIGELFVLYLLEVVHSSISQEPIHWMV